MPFQKTRVLFLGKESGLCNTFMQIERGLCTRDAAVVGHEGAGWRLVLAYPGAVRSRGLEYQDSKKIEAQIELSAERERQGRMSIRCFQ